MLPGRLARDTRVRAVFMWVGVHTLLFVGIGFTTGSIRDPRGVLNFLWVVGLTIALVLIDLRVVRETVLFANLGVSQGRIVRLALPPVIALESALQLALFVALPS